MAIRRVDPAQTFKVICELDSAVITETKDEQEALKKEGKETRHERYLEDLDESKLVLKDPSEDKPTRFIIRCLRNDEYAELIKKHYEMDTVAKTLKVKDNSVYMFELFQKCCSGMEVPQADGSTVTEKVDYNEIGFGVAISIGSAIAIFSALGKNVKKA